MADVADIKAALKSQFETVTDLEKVFTVEPTSVSSPPCVTMFTEGFARRPLESPYVEAEKVIDPIGARTWIWDIACRLWVDISTDVEVAQVRADDLAKQCVIAVENDRSLGGIAVDSAVSSGTFAKVTPVNATDARPLLMCEMAVQVEITEGL